METFAYEEFYKLYSSAGIHWGNKIKEDGLGEASMTRGSDIFLRMTRGSDIFLRMACNVILRSVLRSAFSTS
jgi:hypothetical protein